VVESRTAALRTGLLIPSGLVKERTARLIWYAGRQLHNRTVPGFATKSGETLSPPRAGNAANVQVKKKRVRHRKTEPDMEAILSRGQVKAAPTVAGAAFV
jgi:hypothetical protein